MVGSPRPLPDVGYVAGMPVLTRFVSQTRAGGRVTDVVEYADPAWMIDVRTKLLRPSAYRAVEGWWLSLREGLRSVLFRSPLYCAPRAHVHARGPETAVATLAAVNSGNLLTLANVDPRLILAPGDYVSLRQGAVYGLGMVVEASGAGVNRTVEIEPALPLAITAGAEVYFDRAQILTRPVAGSWQSEEDTLRPVSFQLVESRL